MFDVIIIGSGPAGMTAAIVAARNKLKTLVLTKDFGGNAAQGDSPENSTDFSLFTEEDLVLKFKQQLNSSKDFLELKFGVEVEGIEKNIVSFSVTTKENKIYYSKSIIIATIDDSSNDFDHLTDKDGFGKIKVTASMETSILGIFAAGGTINASEEQALIAAGEGAKAAMTASDYLNRVRL
jgi:thioredoxin reductase